MFDDQARQSHRCALDDSLVARPPAAAGMETAVPDGGTQLDALGAAVGESMRARQGEIEQAIYARIRCAVPDAIADGRPDYQAGILVAIREVFEFCVRRLAYDSSALDAAPDGALAQARRAAALGVSLGTVLRRYVVGHHVFGDFVAQEAVRNPLAGGGSALHRLRIRQEGVLERLSAAIEQAYDDERTAIARSRRQRPLEIVEHLLSEEEVDLAQVAQLDYGLDGRWHLGVIAVGAAAEQPMRYLKDRLGCRALFVSPASNTVWGWLASSRRLSPMEVEHALAARTCDSLLAIGEPGNGVAGWRLTHKQAQHTLPVAYQTATKAALYNPFLSAAMHNDTLAKSLQQKYLVPLTSNRDNAKLRETLRAYIEANGCATAAARALRIRRHTVADRLRTIEELIGCPLYSCLAELRVALEYDALEAPAPTTLAVATDHTGG